MDCSLYGCQSLLQGDWQARQCKLLLFNWEKLSCSQILWCGCLANYCYVKQQNWSKSAIKSHLPLTFFLAVVTKSTLIWISFFPIRHEPILQEGSRCQMYCVLYIPRALLNLLRPWLEWVEHLDICWLWLWDLSLQFGILPVCTNMDILFDILSKCQTVLVQLSSKAIILNKLLKMSYGFC